MNTIELCITHEYCTDCPGRKDCVIREFFYDEQFNSIFSMLTNLVSIEFMLSGHSPDEALFCHTIFEKSITTKREIELTLHPTYSME